MKDFSTLYRNAVILALFGISACQPPAAEQAQITSPAESPAIERSITEYDGRLSKSIRYTMKVDSVNFSIEGALREDSSVAVRFNYYHPFSFEQHLKYQQLLMDELVSDFEPERITSIFLGRLIYTGNLAARVSGEILEEKWDEKSYPQLQQMLEKGTLMTTFTPLLKNYGLKVKSISFEKAFLMDQKMLDQYASVTLPREEIPTHILDCMTWLMIE